ERVVIDAAGSWFQRGFVGQAKQSLRALERHHGIGGARIDGRPYSFAVEGYLNIKVPSFIERDRDLRPRIGPIDDTARTMIGRKQIEFFVKEVDLNVIAVENVACE